jgi:hypothetical protein
VQLCPLFKPLGIHKGLSGKICQDLSEKVLIG